ncbi:MAG: F0F1 ATP synthase subunit B [Anaerolineales bacterium]
MDKLGINLGLLIIQILVFIIVILTLTAWIYKPLVELLEKRRKAIAQGLEDARAAGEARAGAEKEAGGIIAEAQVKASKIVQEATERAEVAGRDVKAAAEAQIAEERAKALATVEEEHARTLIDLRGQVAALAIAAAQKLVGEALDEKRQHALLDEFFSGIKSGKVVVLTDATLSGAAAEVTSALPLTQGEQDTVKQDVLAKSGAADVTFRVDPSILGGLVIKVGGKVLDGSVAGQLEGLRANLR